MARLPPIKRLTTEDFKDQSTWISKLLSPLNEFMGSIATSLNRGLTFQDNLLAQVKELEFTVRASGTYPIEFKSTMNSKPIGLWVASAVHVAGTPATLTTAVWADWQYADGLIKIRSLSGLTTGQKYRITVIIIGG